MKIFKLIPVFFLLSFQFILGQDRYTKVLGLPGYRFEANEAVLTPDGGIIITGRAEGVDTKIIDPYNKPAFWGELSTYDAFMFVYKMNAKGDSSWLRLLPFAFEGMTIAQSKESGYVCAGFTTNPGRYTNEKIRYQNPVVFKLNAEGLYEWYLPVFNNYESVCDKIAAVSDGYWMIASMENPDENIDQLERLYSQKIHLVKINLQGKIIIDKILEPDPFYFTGYWSGDLVITENENLLLTGSVLDSNKSAKPFVMRVDKEGNKTSEQYYNQNDKEEHGTDLLLLEGEEYLLGTMDRDGAYLKKINTKGTVLWSVRENVDLFSGISIGKGSHNRYYMAGELDKAQGVGVVMYDSNGVKIKTYKDIQGHTPVSILEVGDRRMLFIFNRRMEGDVRQIEMIWVDTKD